MVFHPSHRPLEIATRFPQFHSPDDDDISPTNKKHKGTLLSSYRGGHFYWALTHKEASICHVVVRWINTQRQPQMRPWGMEPEPLRKHTDDGMAHTIHVDLSADRLDLTIEALLPSAVTQQCYGLSAWLILFRAEVPTQGRLHSQKRQQVGRDKLRRQPDRIVVDSYIHGRR